MKNYEQEVNFYFRELLNSVSMCELIRNGDLHEYISGVEERLIVSGDF